MSRMFCVISLIVTNRDPGGSRLEGGLGQRGHTGWWGSLSGTCERVGAVENMSAYMTDLTGS